MRAMLVQAIRRNDGKIEVQDKDTREVLLTLSLGSELESLPPDLKWNKFMRDVSMATMRVIQENMKRIMLPTTEGEQDAKRQA